ncbi:MAG TPA: permease [bacterium]|nr:permease [bacterium]
MFGWWQYIVDLLVYDLAGMERGTPVAAAIDFFLFDTVKILLLLIVIIFAITFIRTFFPPERTRRILAAKKEGLWGAHVAAALLGIVTPFCSCSAVPLFIGFVEAGIPLGVTFSYLIAAPMVNEVALGMLYGMFGFKVALIYLVSGEVIAIVSGIIIGRLGLEKWVEECVYTIKVGAQEVTVPTFRERISESYQFTLQVLGKIWLYVLIGIGIGALMHGWIPAGALAQYAGRDNPFAVLVAVVAGVPLYANAAGVIPLVAELSRAGVAMGTALAFMMAVTALSIPEMILLRRVLKPKLLAIFVAIVSLGIIMTGYLFNTLL